MIKTKNDIKLLTYSFMMSGLYVVFQLSEVIAKLTFERSDFEITIVSMIFPLSGLLSFKIKNIILNFGIKKSFSILGWMFFLLSVSILKINTYFHYLLMIFGFSIVYTTVNTIQTTLIYYNFSQTNTGRLVGIAQGLRMVGTVLFAFIAGHLLGWVEYGWKITLLLCSQLSLLVIIVIASMEDNDKEIICKKNSRINLTYKKLHQLLRTNRRFVLFEAGFMIYGTALLMNLPVIPIYLVDTLKLNYTEITFAKATIYHAVMIFSVPFFGYLFDRLSLFVVNSVIFLILSIFPLLLLAQNYFHGINFLWISFCLFGFAMGGVVVSWSISTIFFVRNDENPATYQAAHVLLSGIRAIYSPLLGFLAIRYLGISGALISSSILWVISAIVVFSAGIVPDSEKIYVTI